jgi:hypothetical protein
LTILKHRSWPVNWSEYLIDNSIVGAMRVALQARCARDWGTFLLFQVSQQVLQLTFILFGIQVCLCLVDILIDEIR